MGPLGPIPPIMGPFGPIIPLGPMEPCPPIMPGGPPMPPIGPPMGPFGPIGPLMCPPIGPFGPIGPDIVQLGPEFILLGMETIGPLEPMGPFGPIDMGGKGMFMGAEVGGLMSCCWSPLGLPLPPLSGNSICCILRMVANCSSRCARCCGVRFSSGILTPVEKFLN